MADKLCENGHVIDENWDLCPFCPAPPRAAYAPSAPQQMVSQPQPIQSQPHAVLSKPHAVFSQPHRLEAVPPIAAEEAPVPLGADLLLPERHPSPRSAPSFVGPNRTSVMARPVAVAAVRRYVVGWLVALNKLVRGESFPVRIGRNVIGRDRMSDIYVPDELVSSHHADIVFRPEEKRFILMDSNSTNGTFVNGREIAQRYDLAVNDIITVGSHRFLFVPLCREGVFWEDEGLLK